MIKKYFIYIIVNILIAAFLAGCSSKHAETTAEVSNSNTQANQSNVESNTQTEASSSNTSTVEEVTKIPADKADTSVPKDSFSNKAADNSDVKKKNKIIVIDPGHGGKSTSEKEPLAPASSTLKPKNVSGATGISTKTPEYVIALNVSLVLKDYLSKAGYTVIMTRSSNSETIGNIERAEIGNKNNADLVIRIHADSAEDSSIKGASMLVPSDIGYAKDIYKQSRKYGEIIFNTLLEDVGMKSRGIITRTDLTGFNWSKVPVVLIEMGFLSNSEEDKLLSSKNYEDNLALGLFRGIEKALND